MKAGECGLCEQRNRELDEEEGASAAHARVGRCNDEEDTADFQGDQRSEMQERNRKARRAREEERGEVDEEATPSCKPETYMGADSADQGAIGSE